MAIYHPELGRHGDGSLKYLRHAIRFREVLSKQRRNGMLWNCTLSYGVGSLKRKLCFGWSREDMELKRNIGVELLK